MEAPVGWAGSRGQGSVVRRPTKDREDGIRAVYLQRKGTHWRRNREAASQSEDGAAGYRRNPITRCVHYYIHQIKKRRGSLSATAEYSTDRAGTKSAELRTAEALSWTLGADWELFGERPHLGGISSKRQNSATCNSLMELELAPCIQDTA
ncbi:unnamed protein product [Calypogeia fissa]